MKHLFPAFLLFACCTGSFLSSGCRKDFIDTNSSSKLSFSTDTLTFDTVFTTLGSTTLYFKIYNNNKHTVKTDVTLAGGDASNFRINVDGNPGSHHEGVEVYGKDSTYVFVEVTVDPNGQNTPLVIEDSVFFETNGNRQKVILEAWGQDAHFFRDSLICGTWYNDKPYVIMSTAAIDSGCTLIIEAGTRVYMGGNAQLVVLPTAKLVVNGQLGDTVVFQGIRLEHFYDDLPGQWNGIFILRGSTGNSFNYAVIKNANYGIHVGSPLPEITCGNINTLFASTADVTIKNTIIQNSFVTALTGVFANIEAENCLLFNSGSTLISLGFGGTYTVIHCTAVNYGAPTINHQDATLLLSNLFHLKTQTEECTYTNDLNAIFENTIVYGSLDQELSFGYESAPFNAVFNNCLLKTLRDSDDTLEFNDVIKNEDPLFTDRAKDDYTIEENSPCRDSGKITSVTTDLNGNPRVPPPDIGAYEYQ